MKARVLSGLVGPIWCLLSTCYVTLVCGHVRLDFPVARDLPLDFLDNLRTPAPCGMPKGDTRTLLEAGTRLNVTWHLAYPHQGTLLYSWKSYCYRGQLRSKNVPLKRAIEPMRKDS